MSIHCDITRLRQANTVAVPDFRSSTGLFNTLKAEHKLKGSGKDLFDASVYRDETATSSFHTMVSSMSRMTKGAKPTAFHQMLATLAHEGRLLRLYSQNVDGIDTSLEPLSTRIPLSKDENGKWPKTVQLHGGLDKMVCSKCHDLSDFDADLFDGPLAPLCPNCETLDDLRTNLQGKRSHGIGRMRPRMVLYNEHNPDDVAIGKVSTEDMNRRPDAVIVVGTTLKVPGIQRIAKEMCKIVRDRKDGMAIWINNDPPPSGQQFADCWDIVVEGPADEVATRAALRRWDDPIQPEELGNISDEDVLKHADNRKASVVLSSKWLPKELDPMPLPAGHINNSFRPPTIAMPETPRRSRSLSQSPEYSPLTSRRPSAVRPSIEDGEIGDNIVVAESGLLTPSKSQKGTPPMPSILEQLKDKPQQSKKASAKAAAPKKAPAKKTKAAAPAKKQSNVKYIKPAKSAAKPTGKGAKQKPLTGAGALTATFSKSKGSAVELGAKEKDVDKPSTPFKNPSKLSMVLNASSDRLAPLSPADARNNLSPSRSRSSLPNLSAEEKTLFNEKKRTMSMANICN